ncbi:hypothetical protein MMC13_002126 [Lambiella insularis]|nr:hypothetical protein [Lambiella insularis]
MLSDSLVVVEDFGNTPSDQEEDAEVAQTGDARKSQAARSPESLSAISGTTTRTSHSAEELSNMDAVEMLDALPELHRTTEELFQTLMPKERSSAEIEVLTKRLQDPTLLITKKMARLSQSFEAPKKLYGNEIYINVSIALRGVMAVRRPIEVGKGPWRPDDIFYKANVAKLASDVLALHPEAILPWIEKMEREFPTPFLAKVTRAKQTTLGVSQLLQQTLDVAFLIRVQLFLSLLNENYQQANFDPDVLLKQVFYNSLNAIKGWDIDGLRSHEITKQQQKVLVAQLETIQANFNEAPILDVERLNAQYPRPSFRAAILSWAKMRKDEIDARLTSLGGALRIQELLVAEVQRRTVESAENEEVRGSSNSPINLQLDFRPTSENSHFPSDQPQQSKSMNTRSRVISSTAGPNYSTPTVTSALRKKLAATKAEQAAALQQSTRRDGEQPTMAPAKASDEIPIRNIADDWAPTQIEDDDGDTEHQARERRRASPSARAAHIVMLHEKEAAEQDKENRPQHVPASTASTKSRSLFDRQPHAERISFDSQLEDSRDMPSNSRHKRLRQGEPEEQQMSDPSEDESFQRDTRALPPRPGLKNRGSAPISPAKRVRLNDDKERSARGGSEVVATRAEVSRLDTASQPSSTQAGTYKAVQTEAKKLTSLHVPRRKQKRIPWSEEETDRLIDLIGDYGVSWSLLKTMDKSLKNAQDRDNILVNRDQVGLKDKARNMKVDYLKTGITLPHNFDGIALKQTDWDKLKQLGIRQVEHSDDEDEDD